MTALLSDLVERGLDSEQGMLLCSTDRKRSARPCGRCSARCPSRDAYRHKERNVMQPSPRARPATDQGPAAQGVGGDRLPPGARATHAARGRARAHAPRRRQLAARRDGGDADRDPARDQGPAQANARVDEPGRVDDRHASARRSATSRTGPPGRWGCGGPPRGCSKPRSSSAR